MKNHPIASLVALFARIWLLRLNLRGCGIVIRTCRRMFPGIRRYWLDYPGLGQINIEFLDLAWIQQRDGKHLIEGALLHTLARVSPKDAVVWDVGANSGYLAAELLLRLRPSRLDLLEPNTAHRQTLDSLASLDSRVRVHSLGLSDSVHDGSLFVPAAEAGGFSRATVRRELLSDDRVDSVAISLLTGDTLTAAGSLQDPDLVIIDVEGHEPEVLQGMCATVARARPILVIEHIFLTDQVMHALIPVAYSVHTICDRDSALVPGIHRDIGHNVIMLPPGRIFASGELDLTGARRGDGQSGGQ